MTEEKTPVIYSIDEWRKKQHIEIPKEEIVLDSSVDSQEEDEFVEILSADDDVVEDIPLRQPPPKPSPIESSFINIVNCSDKNIMITNLLGPSEPLVLGTLEDPSSRMPRPFRQLNISARSLLDSNLEYQNLKEKGLLQEVSLNVLKKFVNKYNELMSLKYEQLAEKESRELVGMNSFQRFDNEEKVRSSERGSVESEVDMPAIGIGGETPITPDEDMEKQVIRELGVSESETSKFYR